MTDLTRSLELFKAEKRFFNPGALSVALVVTRHARELGFPLRPDDLVTPGGGQVKGLSGSKVRSILKDHGVERGLGTEAGRTSRGSIGNMRDYVDLLNSLQEQGDVDLDAVEVWWVARVVEYFDNLPFVLHFDPSKSVRVVVRDLIDQARKRQQQGQGRMFAGTVLQHLVGAKLDLVLSEQHIEHHGASVADGVSGREADFMVGDVAVHVTMSPGDLLIEKCQRNLRSGRRPLIITAGKGVDAAEWQAEVAGILDKVEIFEAEQFLAGNIYEHGKFGAAGRIETAEQMVRRYNEIVAQCEADPSLRIEVAR